MKSKASNAKWLKDQWALINKTKRKKLFFSLPKKEQEEIFLKISPHDQVELLEDEELDKKQAWLSLLPLDDAADFLQKLPKVEQEKLLNLKDKRIKYELKGLLAYAEDEAGGLMNPEYIRLRPEMTADEAICYLRAQGNKSVGTFYCAYVLDRDQVLLGVVSFRDVLLAHPEVLIEDIMKTQILFVLEDLDREKVAMIFSKNSHLMAIPVVDAQKKMKGVVTFDDIAKVVKNEATEDIQKLGGMEALDAPYIKVSFIEMIKKRSGWLTILFLGEMFTATAMGYFEDEISKAVVLALFIPLIISSGGNSGSQASTLIIRSLALEEIRLRDWWRIFIKEVLSGVVLGSILGLIGFFRIVIWQQYNNIYGQHYILVATTVAFSLIGVVLWGTLSGSMLPFLLRKLGFDPASASAPFVATLVDVTGLMIYFTVASFILKGTLL